MKTVISKTVFAIALVVLCVSTVSADGLKVKAKKQLASLVKKHISYPENLKIENKSGIVLIDLFVDKSGNLVINQINASDNVFKSHVEKKIEELNELNDYSGIIGQNLLYKFKFNVE